MMTSSTFVAHKKCKQSGSFGKQSGFTAKQSGFTLIELLVVIAIIAILAAIIFPVFSSVQENARRSSTMTNMMRIYQATAAFELDNRRYPEFLFGPALDNTGNLAAPAGGGPAVSPNEVAAMLRSNKRLPVANAAVVASKNAKYNYRNSLFPEYINDISVFSCANNQEATTANSKATADVTRPCTADDTERVDDGYDGANLDCRQATGNLTSPDAPGIRPVTLPFYKFDAFDSSPLVNPNSTISKTVYLPRYSRVWTPILNSTDLATAQASNVYPFSINETQYKRQMLFKNPGGETILTMTTHHVPKTKVVVLFLNGSVKVWDVGQLLKKASEPTICPTVPAGNEKPDVCLSPNGN
jgi:prepilin-type N-terminal cleavage/methylation domain-containing protein